MAVPVRRIGVLVTTVIAIAVAAAGAAPSASAQVNPVVSVDAVPDSANTATAVGTIDACRSAPAGPAFTIDVVIQGVTDITGFQANLLYDPAILSVTAVNYNFLLGTTGAAVLDLGATTPDTDGDFLLAAAMFSAFSVTGASGSGVMARITLQGVGPPGSSALDLAGVKLTDSLGTPIPPSDASKFYTGPVNDASVVVGGPCGPPAPDADADGVVDSSDNCPNWPNPSQNMPPWTVPAGDPDCDGWTTSDENFITTIPTDACGASAWPPDFNDDTFVNIVDINILKPAFFSSAPGPPYSVRLDLTADGNINITDINRLKPFFFLGCTL